MEFSAQGEYEVRIEGRVLVAVAGGCWNIEMHRQSMARCSPLIAELVGSGSPWGVLTIIRDSIVTQPDVLAAGREAMQGMAGVPGLVGLAWAIPSSAYGYGLLIDHYRRMCEGVAPYVLCDEEDEARAWLEVRLAAA